LEKVVSNFGEAETPRRVYSGNLPIHTVRNEPRSIKACAVNFKKHYFLLDLT
jgi:hypothetical protein